MVDGGEHATGGATSVRRSARHCPRGTDVLPPWAVLAPVAPPSAVIGTKLERLRRSLEASQAAFGAADREFRAVRDLLAVAIGRVAEPEAEILKIRYAVDEAARFIHARGGSHMERLLDIPDRVRDAVVFGVHRGAATALTVAQAHSDHILYHLVGLLVGQRLSDFAAFPEDFDEAADTVVNLVPAKRSSRRLLAIWVPDR